MIYTFLRSVRVTFIPAVTVPIALIGTLAAMWAAGFSINILTLLAIVLATGLVVDDAIVVIENISRQRALGLGPRAAAVIGTRQVFLAVLATTCTLAAVFIPISFLPGVAGSLFSEFGFVLAFAVVLSGIVALTLTPMLASRWIGEREAHHHSNNFVGKRSSRSASGRSGSTRACSTAALPAPLVVVRCGCLFAGAAYIGFQHLPSELAPREDRGVVSITVGSPPGLDRRLRREPDSPDRGRRAAVRQERRGREPACLMARGGGGGGRVSMRLAPFGQRTLTRTRSPPSSSRSVANQPGIQVFAQSGNGSASAVAAAAA